MTVSLQDNVLSAAGKNMWAEPRSALQEALFRPKEPNILWKAAFAWHVHLCDSSLMNITKKNYLAAFVHLIKKDYLVLETPLEAINQDWLDKIQYSIDKTNSWAESTRRHRKMIAAKFFIFTQQFKAMLAKNPSIECPPCPSKDDVEFALCLNKDYQKASTIPSEKWDSFLNELLRRNDRDCLVFITMLLSACRVEEVLELKQENVADGSLSFRSHVVEIPVCITNLMKARTPNKDGFIFVSATGKPVKRNQIARALREASVSINLDAIVTPRAVQNTARMLRAAKKESENKQNT